MVAVYLGVTGTEGICQSLDLDGDHDEVVQSDRSLAGVKLRQQVLQEGRGEPEKQAQLSRVHRY